MGWKIIEISKGNYLKLFLNNLVVYCDDERIVIPIKDVDVLLIDNIKATISIQLLNELATNDVLVLICDSKHMPKLNALPIISHHNSLKILQSQLAWNHAFKSNTWVSIVKQKIKNQADLIDYYGLDEIRGSEIRSLMNDVKEYDISNREGHASKIYWHTLFGLDFSRQDDSDINFLLNYGYSILYSYVSRSIVKKGLDPRISLFHKSFNNFFALSSDLMEPFRVLIDRKVFEIVKIRKEKDINQIHREELVKVFNDKIVVGNSQQFINHAIDFFIDSVISQSLFLKFNFFYDK